MLNCTTQKVNFMTFARFVELWAHRRRKYFHILKAHISGWKSVVYFAFRKYLVLRNRPLIAIVRTEHFGDIVAAEPLSRHLRTQFPDAHIVWFVKPVFQELVDSNPNIDEVHAEYCVSERKVIRNSGIFTHFFELQFKNNNYCPKCQLFTENPIAAEKGINVDNYFQFGNLLDVFVQTSGIPGKPEDVQPRLYLKSDNARKIDSLNLPENFLVIHTQTNYAPKDWPVEKWEALIQQLLSFYPLDIIEVGLSSNLQVKDSRYHNLCGKLTILDTAEVIRRSRFFIGLDSGPAHLANAVNVTGFILMGSLNTFPIYNPFSGNYGTGINCTLIRNKGQACSSLEVSAVFKTITSQIKPAVGYLSPREALTEQ